MDMSQQVFETPNDYSLSKEDNYLIFLAKMMIEAEICVALIIKWFGVPSSSPSKSNIVLRDSLCDKLEKGLSCFEMFNFSKRKLMYLTYLVL